MLAYLDNSATTRPTEPVIEAMTCAMREGFYNPSSVYAEALVSEKAMNDCRGALQSAAALSCHEVIFTSGGTEANNLAILGSAAKMRGRLRVLVGATEHPSVLAPFEQLRAQGAEVLTIPVLSDGSVDYDALSELLSGGANLASFMQVNNETGALLDAARFCGLIRQKCPDCLIHIDGVQGFLRAPLDAQPDLYTLSGHKIHGPKGVGALLVRKGVRLEARNMGGGQEKTLRSGTENTPGIAGLCAAVSTFDKKGLAGKKAYLAQKILSAVPDALVNGPRISEGAPHILNMSFPGVRGEVMLHALEEEGVLISTGSACSSKKRKVSSVLLAMGISPDRAEAAVRMSLSPLTGFEELDYAAQRVFEKYEVLKRFKRR